MTTVASFLHELLIDLMEVEIICEVKHLMKCCEHILLVKGRGVKDLALHMPLEHLY